MFKIRKELMQELGKPRAKYLRAAQIASLRQQGFQVEEDPQTNDLLIADKAGGRVSVASLPDGVAVTSGEQRTHKLQVDDGGKLASITDPAGNRVRFAHDSRGRLIGLSTASDRIHKFEYDDSNRVTSIQFPDKTTTRFAYDFVGNLTQVGDRNGCLAGYSYYPGGQLARVTDWQGNVTSYGYSSDQVPTTVVLPNGNRRDWVHEPGSNHCKLLINGVEHASAGASEDHEDTYEVSCKDGTWARYVIRSDHVVEAINDICTVKFEYDDQGRVLKEETDGKVVQYLRNPVGALIGLVTPEGEKLTFRRDSEQRVTGIVDWNGGRFGFGYAPSGALQKIEYPNAASAEFTTNAVGLPESMRVMIAQSSIAEYRWENDIRDRVVAMTFPGEKCSYRYNAEGRLAGENQVTYQLDGNGNRIADSVGSATFDAANQIVSWAGRAFQHDARGNMTSGVCPKGDAQFTYDGLDRLIAVKTGRIEAKYFYDALGRRARKEVGGRVTTFLWAGEQLLSETTTENGISTRRDYLHFPELKLPLAMRVNGKIRYFHTGRRAEPLCMTGPEGELLWQARYSAFGETNIGLERESQPWRLPGQYQDDETGLCYVFARYYNPQLGRFLTSDPLGLEGGSFNLYTYCDGDPVNRVDPTGGFAFLAVIAIGAVIGAAVGGAVEAYKQHKAHPDQPLDWGSIAKEAGKGAVVGAVGAGLGLLLAPAAGALGTGLAAVTIGGAIVGGVTAGVEQCVDNKLHDKPLFEGIWPAIGIGAAIGAVTAGAGAIWANRARRAALAAREAEEAARRAEREAAEAARRAREAQEAERRAAEEEATREAAERARLARRNELAKDPAQGGKITPKTLREADVAMDLESQGRLKSPVTREPTGAADFVDGNGTEWDVKQFNSKFPPNKGGFDLTDSMTKINKSLRDGENVILDTVNMSPADLSALKQAVEAQGLGNKVIFYP
jgi:RHS repeat-associated protein